MQMSIIMESEDEKNQSQLMPDTRTKFAMTVEEDSDFNAKVEQPSYEMPKDEEIELPRVMMRPENIDITKGASFADKVLSAESLAKPKEEVKIPILR